MSVRKLTVDNDPFYDGDALLPEIFKTADPTIMEANIDASDMVDGVDKKTGTSKGPFKHGSKIIGSRRPTHRAIRKQYEKTRTPEMKERDEAVAKHASDYFQTKAREDEAAKVKPGLLGKAKAFFSSILTAAIKTDQKLESVMVEAEGTSRVSLGQVMEVYPPKDFAQIIAKNKSMLKANPKAQEYLKSLHDFVKKAAHSMPNASEALKSVPVAPKEKQMIDNLKPQDKLKLLNSFVVVATMTQDPEVKNTAATMFKKTVTMVNPRIVKEGAGAKAIAALKSGTYKSGQLH